MRCTASGVGIGLRQPHYRELLAQPADLALVEVHSENYFWAGGASLAVLEQARQRWPVSLHGVGLALGSADALSHQHLDQLAKLVERIEPAWVSEHVCWGAHDGKHFNELLPMPYNNASLAWFADRVDQVQERLRRPILIENLSAYLRFDDDTFSDLAFLNALAQRTGCGVLLDLNNLYVNAVNFGFDAAAQLADLDMRHVGELHLAGHACTDIGLIDDHGSAVSEPVWALYRQVRPQCPQAVTIIEWDNAIPPLSVLLDEADRAARIALPEPARQQTPGPCQLGS